LTFHVKHRAAGRPAPCSAMLAAAFAGTAAWRQIQGNQEEKKGNDVATIERSLVIVKPDAVQRGLIGEVIRRYEQRGLKIAGIKFEVVSRATAERHYGEHRGKPFYEGLVSYITSSPSVLMVVEGPEAVEIVRKTNGDTKPAAAQPGTIRADFGLTIGRNLVHASDSVESAAREVDIFFGGGGIVEYERAIDTWINEE